MATGPVAVIDIGSNSIKLLVASRAGNRGYNSVATKTIEARISQGISRVQSRLTDESMARGVAAVRDLVAEAEKHAPQQLVMVATSAVRDAQNGNDFRESVRVATGHSIRILSGDEEANLIGRGLTCDPALAGLRDFYLLDLGGGSLECLAFRDRRISHAQSFQLGCVRLTEKFVADPSKPLAPNESEAIADEVRRVITPATFRFDLPPTATAVGTGGTLTTARAILAAEQGRALDSTSPTLTIAQLRDLLARVDQMSLAERRKIAGLPAGRADVFPAALVTLIAAAELGKFSAYLHSFYNLRWGLAAELLDRG